MKLSLAIDDYFIARSDLARATVSNYRIYLDMWCAHARDCELDAVTGQDLRAFAHWLANDYRPKTGVPLGRSGLKNAHIALRSFWHWAADTYGLDNISTELTRPRVPTPEIIPFTRDEVQALLKACYHTRITEPRTARPYRSRRPEAERDAAMLLLLLDTGIRVSELCRLELGDVRFNHREIEIRPYESGLKSRPRVIPFTRDTLALLQRWLAMRRDADREPLDLDGRLTEDAPLFCLLRTGYGRTMPRRAVGHVLSRLGERACVDNVHPHRLRHTFAIEYLRGGGDVYTLQRILGHSTLEMVRRYLALSEQDVRRTHERASAVSRWRLMIPK